MRKSLRWAMLLVGAAVAGAIFTRAAMAWRDHGPAAGEPAMQQDPALPPGADGAVARLEASPRHGEWQVIHSGEDSIRAWVVYPERSGPAPVVLVVHEVFGLSNWIRAVADQVAADGFIAIAPDLLTMKNLPVAEDGATNPDSARGAIRSLERATVDRYLLDVAKWGMALPAAKPVYGIVGFCWGGTTSFAHAVASPELGASVVYYGSSPATEDLAKIQAPVLGLYGGEDARVGATVPPAEAEMKRLGKVYEPHMFEGAGHGFLRQQDGRDGANMAATKQAWPMTVAWFKKYLDS